MSKSLPYSTKDVNYDNAKFRHRSFTKALNQTMLTNNVKRECVRCSTGKFLLVLMLFGVAYLMLTPSKNSDVALNKTDDAKNTTLTTGSKLKRFFRKPPRLPPRFSPDEMHANNGSSTVEASKWNGRQQKVREAFVHAWSGYKRYAMGFDELMPLSKRGNDGLGGLGATVVDALDTAMIMGVKDIVSEAGSWIETHLAERISHKGEVNLFETTIRVLGGLLSAYHLSGGSNASSIHEGPNPRQYLEIATSLADRLLSAFTFSPTPIPYSDVVLHDKSAHPAPDGLSSTSEVSTLQLEFNYLSEISGDSKYSLAAMRVLEHIKTLPKVEGLVPIYISPQTGQFNGENIRLGSRGDSYYEYLLKVWLQLGANSSSNFTYLHSMYEEAMKGVRHLLVRKSIPNGLVFVGELPYGAGGSFSPKMDHLVCFLPGTLALGATKGLTKSKAMKENLLTVDDLENLRLAEELAKTCFEMYSVTSTGLAPEIAYFHVEDFFEEGHDGGNKSSKYVNDIIIRPADRHNLLRPETVESLFVLYRITEDPKYREWGWQIFEAFEKYTKVDSGGYTSLNDVTALPPHRRDKMETFFLGETLKYIYLLFGDSNIMPLDKFVFNTEAHPIPVSASIKSDA
ncbi:mannosyl-oligosaccharide 1,2-alpha-mannosidase MNS3 [Silene latifolia]|uniref:mannosyl-oligosaccharide 1,2-alpha-mannosidase MNS3 n=1 Tax=Silene latifolia TaxID=37657 RepID=UPI003D77EA5C